MTPEEVAAYRIDRTGWAPGPWDTEPDRVDWQHAGLPCFVLRNHYGAWCGYVGVLGDHPYWGYDYGALDVDVHGGLTYADVCAPPICHAPAPGERDVDRHWFGFDCGHAFDVMPGLDAHLASLFAAHADDPEWAMPQYRTLAYAQAETNRLAEQLAALADGPDRAQGIVGGDDKLQRPPSGDQGGL